MTGALNRVRTDSRDELNLQDMKAYDEPKRLSKKKPEHKRLGSNAGFSSNKSLVVANSQPTEREVRILKPIAAKEKLLDTFSGDGEAAVSLTAYNDRSQEFFGVHYSDLSSTQKRFVEKHVMKTRAMILREATDFCMKIIDAHRKECRFFRSLGVIEDLKHIKRVLSFDEFRKTPDQDFYFAMHVLNFKESFQIVNRRLSAENQQSLNNAFELYIKFDAQLTKPMIGLEDFSELLVVPPSFWEREGLEELSLNFSLTHLSDEIGKLVQLSHLDLSQNFLSALPEEMKDLTCLRDLNLDGNLFGTFPLVIGQVTSLSSLSMQKNQLTDLPGVIGHLTHLTDLDLRGNQLTSLPLEMCQMTRLKFLDLSENQITWDGLPEKLQAFFTKMKKKGLEIIGLDIPKKKIKDKLKDLKKQLKK